MPASAAACTMLIWPVVNVSSMKPEANLLRPPLAMRTPSPSAAVSVASAFWWPLIHAPALSFVTWSATALDASLMQALSSGGRMRTFQLFMTPLTPTDAGCPGAAGSKPPIEA